MPDISARHKESPVWRILPICSIQVVALFEVLIEMSSRIVNQLIPTPSLRSAVAQWIEYRTANQSARVRISANTNGFFSKCFSGPCTEKRVYLYIVVFGNC